MVLFKILFESTSLAVQELAKNKLRSFLSLLGITIGILCIISVFAAVDSLERNIRGTLSQMGDNVVYVEKWPWQFGSEYPWWKYINRPEAGRRDFKAIQDKAQKADAVAIQFALQNKRVKYRNQTVSGATVFAISHEYDEVMSFSFAQGRYFSPSESAFGDNVVFIGHNVAEELFAPGEDPIGKNIRVVGRKMRVTGVIEKEGESLISFDLDNMVTVPYNFMSRYVDEDAQAGQRILVEAKAGVSLAELKNELTQILRKARRLRPTQEDNFALNQMSIVSQGITQTFGVINLAGLLIGGFSILVGGFGIANIMFVSVRERTNIIGVKKALGAKSYFILLEFLIESVVLCLIGGTIGLLLVYGLLLIGNELINFTFILSTGNIILGLTISFLIGVVSGFFPALTAAKMNPVEAMRK